MPIIDLNRGSNFQLNSLPIAFAHMSCSPYKKRRRQQTRQQFSRATETKQHEAQPGNFEFLYLKLG